MNDKETRIVKPLTEAQIKEIRAEIVDRMLARATALSVIMAVFGGIAGWSFSTISKNRDQANQIKAYETSISTVAEMSRDMTKEVDEALDKAEAAKAETKKINEEAKSNLEAIEQLKADYATQNTPEQIRADLLSSLLNNDDFKSDVAIKAHERLAALEDALKVADIEVKALAEKRRREKEKRDREAVEETRRNQEARRQEELRRLSPKGPNSDY